MRGAPAPPTLLGAENTMNTAGRLGLPTQLKCSYALPSCVLHSCISAGSEHLSVLEAAMLPPDPLRQADVPIPKWL